MQISVTNLSGVTVPFNTSTGPFGLPPGASNVALTLPDSEQANIAALRTLGKISFSYTLLPNQAPDFGSGRVGRNEVTGAAYTTQASDNGTIIECLNACTLTLDARGSRGMSVSILQAGTGAVTFAVGAGGTLRLPGTATKTNGQWTLASAFVRDNPGGAAAEWVVAGNIA